MEIENPIGKEIENGMEGEREEDSLVGLGWVEIGLAWLALLEIESKT